MNKIVRFLTKNRSIMKKNNFLFSVDKLKEKEIAEEKNYILR